MNYLAPNNSQYRYEAYRDELGNIVPLRIDRATGESQRIEIAGKAMPQNAYDVRHYFSELNKYTQTPFAFIKNNYLMGGE